MYCYVTANHSQTLLSLFEQRHDSEKYGSELLKPSQNDERRTEEENGRINKGKKAKYLSVVNFRVNSLESAPIADVITVADEDCADSRAMEGCWGSP
jgi:hypothetical protein